jgi:hypothetical protein
VIRVVAAAAAIGAAIAGAALGVLLTLPQPSSSARLGVRVLEILRHERGGGSILEFGDVRHRASCRRVSRRVHVVSLSNGERFAIRGTKVRLLHLPAGEGRLLASISRPEILAAEADLAGSFALYASQLTRRLVGGDEVLAGRSVFARRPVYRIVLRARAPRVELLVERSTLWPIGARYASARLTGAARLLPATGRAGC